MSKKKSKEEHLSRIHKKHGDTYNYSLVENIESCNSKIPIICQEHGIFYQRVTAHANGQGCPECQTNKKKSSQEWVQELQKKYKNYTISNEEMNKIKNGETFIIIRCLDHGEFITTPHNLMRGYGCKKCSGWKFQKKTRKEWIELFEKKQGVDTYDYKLIPNDFRSTDKIQIICHKHGIFSQPASQHARSQGCPYCRESKGEKIIRVFLEQNQIEYIRQYTYPDCKGIRNKLPFDFFLPKYNLLIEFHGEQHYIGWKANKKSLLIIQQRDKIKTEYCSSNNIPLLVIKFDENIEEKLQNQLNAMQMQAEISGAKRLTMMV